MILREYLDGMRAATTAAELEAAIQAPFKHPFCGRTWTTICKVRIEAGQRICAAHPHGHLVPRLGERRRLTVCGETYRVGYGGNGTGERYVRHAAGEWAKGLLVRAGLSQQAAHAIWDEWSDYPHRCLDTIEAALAGKLPDPELNVLIRHRVNGGHPIRLTVEQNEADKLDRRASRPCPCGGTLFDWGGGHSAGFEFINWHCNACPDVFTEYMTWERFAELRQPRCVPSGPARGGPNP